MAPALLAIAAVRSWRVLPCRSARKVRVACRVSRVAPHANAPPIARPAFPRLVCRSGIDKAVLNQMRALFDLGVAPGVPIPLLRAYLACSIGTAIASSLRRPCSHMRHVPIARVADSFRATVLEAQSRQHAVNRLEYLMECQLMRHLGAPAFSGDVPVFSEFAGDARAHYAWLTCRSQCSPYPRLWCAPSLAAPLEYGGLVPCGLWFSKAYQDYLETLSDYMALELKKRGAKRLKIDVSYKVRGRYTLPRV